MVPQGKLNKWLKNQTRDYHSTKAGGVGKLREGRVEKLQSIGFDLSKQK
jgi:hypothetical protein